MVIPKVPIGVLLQNKCGKSPEAQWGEATCKQRGVAR